MWGYFILGHEFADYESTRQEIEDVYKYEMGYVQLTVLTPFPMTPLWDHLSEKYGIFEKNWARFDTKHLVWNHPKLSSGQVVSLVEHARRRLNSPERFFRFIWKIYRCYVEYMDSYARALAFVSTFPLKAHRPPEDPPYFDESGKTGGPG